MVTLIVAVLFTSSLSLLSNPSSDIPLAPVPAGISYSSHVTISINGNAQFNNTGFPNNGVVSGNGSASNPYIIEGWDISAAAATGIYITNTSAYFSVKNSYIHGGGTFYHGITLDNCINGVVENNTCSNNNYGIYLWLSSSIVLVNNTCSMNTGVGVGLGASNNNNISNNNCSNNRLGSYIYFSDDNLIGNNIYSLNDWYGIYLYSSSGNALANNTCSYNDVYGIYLESSSNNTLSNNTCNSDNEFGIALVTSNSNTLYNNTCSGSDGGIGLSSSNSNTLNNNNCSNDGLGMWLGSSSDNAFSNNNFSSNIAYGIYFSGAGSSNNRIWNNTFYHNNGTGDTYNPTHIQAYDAGTNNWWNSTNGYGNYWADWTIPDVAYRFEIVDLPYNITGAAGAKDYYPLTSPRVGAPPIPEFSEIIVPIVGLMLIALVFGRARKKP